MLCCSGREPELVKHILTFLLRRERDFPPFALSPIPAEEKIHTKDPKPAVETTEKGQRSPKRVQTWKSWVWDTNAWFWVLLVVCAVVWLGLRFTAVPITARKFRLQT